MNLPLDNLLLALFLVLARMLLFQLLDGKLPLVNLHKPCIILTLLLDNGVGDFFFFFKLKLKKKNTMF
jgi:hypothetical protein